MTRGRAKPAPLVSSRPPALSGTSSHPASRLSMLDSVFRAIESFDRPQDFTVILQLRDPPDREALRAGARSARNLYPTTGCRVEGGYWIRLPESPDEVYHADLRCEPQHPGHRSLDINEHLARFLDDDLDLTRDVPVRQLLVTGAPDEGACLATRFHHAAGDYMSAMMWLRHQLQVALRLRPEADEPPGPSPIALRRHTGRGERAGMYSLGRPVGYGEEDTSLRGVGAGSLLRSTPTGYETPLPIVLPGESGSPTMTFWWPARFRLSGSGTEPATIGAADESASGCP